MSNMSMSSDPAVIEWARAHAHQIAVDAKMDTALMVAMAAQADAAWRRETGTEPPVDLLWTVQVACLKACAVHDDWVKNEAMRIWREVGSHEPTMENAALVEMNCVGRRADGYERAVGRPPPAGIEKEVASAYWAHVATSPPPPEKPHVARERLRAAVQRFGDAMGLAPPTDLTPT
jgi:hypothetical protein